MKNLALRWQPPFKKTLLKVKGNFRRQSVYMGFYASSHHPAVNGDTLVDNPRIDPPQYICIGLHRLRSWEHELLHLLDDSKSTLTIHHHLPTSYPSTFSSHDLELAERINTTGGKCYLCASKQSGKQKAGQGRRS
jgi:hypothetical protein